MNLQADMACDASRLLSLLSVRERFTFLSHVLEGAPFIEIGRELGCSGGNASLIYGRALHKMQTSAKRGSVTFHHYFNGLCFLHGNFFPGEHWLEWSFRLERRQNAIARGSGRWCEP